VQGLASSTPFDKADPLSPANRRISIIVMNREAEDRLLRNAPLTTEAPPEAETSPTRVAAVPAR
jgi:chemotaxis protein MotB